MSAKIAGVFVAGALAGAGVHAIVRAPVIETVRVTVPVPIAVPVEVEVVREVAAPAEVGAPPPPRRARPVQSLARERVLLERARAALARRNAGDAITALAAHRDQFPSGQLREERLALEVQALVSAERRAEARARAEELRREFPRSLFLPVVEAALAD